jgi:hypothetical protein
MTSQQFFAARETRIVRRRDIDGGLSLGRSRLAAM